MKTEASQEILIDASWALSNLTEGDDDRIELFLKTDLVSSVIRQIKPN